MTEFTYTTKGTCSKAMTIYIENDTLIKVEIARGCQGNLTGISKLVEGMKINEVIEKLKGIDCNGKGTSCPDQLACALMQYQSKCSA